MSQRSGREKCPFAQHLVPPHVLPRVLHRGGGGAEKNATLQSDCFMAPIFEKPTKIATFFFRGGKNSLTQQRIVSL
jgi:hypothetical protein